MIAKKNNCKYGLEKTAFTEKNFCKANSLYSQKLKSFKFDQTFSAMLPKDGVLTVFFISLPWTQFIQTFSFMFFFQIREIIPFWTRNILSNQCWMTESDWVISSFQFCFKTLSMFKILRIVNCFTKHYWS